MSNENGTIEEKLQQTDLNSDNREGEAKPAENSVSQQTDHHSPESHPDSHPESDRRRYQRGGRKTNPSDGHKPWSERNGRLEQQPEFDSGSEGEAEKQATTTQGSKCATCGKSAGSSSGTGIKAFNLKRAEQTGSRAPFGVRVDRSREEKAKSEKKKQGKGKKKKKKQQQESSDEESEESDDEEPEKRKPVAIRLDLNLELEIFLRAKVKGDITITFL